MKTKEIVKTEKWTLQYLDILVGYEESVVCRYTIVISLGIK
jgi:hypothetical protein